MVYDTMLMFGILFTATLIPSLILSHQSVETVENEQIVHELHPLVSGLPFQIYLLTLWVIFFSWFWRKQGQTLGMQAWRLKVESQDGSTITIKQCALRLAGAALSIGLFGLGYWWIWIDKDGLSWPDRLSGTQVVLLPKK
jgi:uncharacterized RDD family membrane protein YckC